MNPYNGKSPDLWSAITQKLVDAHPLTPCIVDLCLKSWQSILNGKINTYLNLLIKDMRISPQATGALLHDVVPEYIEKNVKGFRKGVGKESVSDPKILLIQMGWLDHSDWRGQKSETGQQVSLTKEARSKKFVVLYKQGLEGQHAKTGK